MINSTNSNDDIIFADIDPDSNHIFNLYPTLNSDNSTDYYDFTKFRGLECNQPTNFSIIHFNIRSLLSKIDHVQHYLHLLGINFDIMCFTESWLNVDNKDLAQLPGYNAFHCLRPSKLGGGVSIYVNSQRWAALQLKGAALPLPLQA